MAGGVAPRPFFCDAKFMKIFHASLTREFAGSEMYCASLAAAQAAEGDEVRVVVKGTRNQGTEGTKDSRIARWKREIGGAELVVVPWWVPSFADSWAIGKMMQGFEPDVVHTHLGQADKKAGKAAKRYKFPWVTTVHLRWKNEVMRGADAAICIAGWQKNEIMNSSYKGFLRTVWNWLPKQNVAASKDVDALRAAWGCTAKTVVFGSVGRLHGQKGMDILIKAFMAAYPDPETDVRLVIVGEGADRVKLEAIVGPERRVILAGYMPEMAPVYEALDVYVSASRYEPFGLTILEAMAHGRQLVCTRTEGPSEFLQEASAKGLVMWAERGNVESLAAVMRVAQVQGRGSVSYDLRPFAIARAVKEIAEVYAEVVRK